MPGFDLTAHYIDKKKSVKIQVKYSRIKNNDGVKIHNFSFDFLISAGLIPRSLLRSVE